MINLSYKVWNFFFYNYKCATKIEIALTQHRGYQASVNRLTVNGLFLFGQFNVDDMSSILQNLDDVEDSVLLQAEKIGVFFALPGKVGNETFKESCGNFNNLNTNQLCASPELFIDSRNELN